MEKLRLHKVRRNKNEVLSYFWEWSYLFVYILNCFYFVIVAVVVIIPGVPLGYQQQNLTLESVDFSFTALSCFCILHND
jgi:hypothetical protein